MYMLIHIALLVLILFEIQVGEFSLKKNLTLRVADVNFFLFFTADVGFAPDRSYLVLALSLEEVGI